MNKQFVITVVGSEPGIENLLSKLSDIENLDYMDSHTQPGIAIITTDDKESATAIVDLANRNAFQCSLIEPAAAIPTSTDGEKGTDLL